MACCDVTFSPFTDPITREVRYVSDQSVTESCCKIIAKPMVYLASGAVRMAACNSGLDCNFTAQPFTDPNTGAVKYTARIDTEAAPTEPPTDLCDNSFQAFPLYMKITWPDTLDFGPADPTDDILCGGCEFNPFCPVGEYSNLGPPETYLWCTSGSGMVTCSNHSLIYNFFAPEFGLGNNFFPWNMRYESRTAKGRLCFRMDLTAVWLVQTGDTGYDPCSGGNADTMYLPVIVATMPVKLQTGARSGTNCAEHYDPTFVFQEFVQAGTWASQAQLDAFYSTLEELQPGNCGPGVFPYLPCYEPGLILPPHYIFPSTGSTIPFYTGGFSSGSMYFQNRTEGSNDACAPSVPPLSSAIIGCDAIRIPPIDDYTQNPLPNVAFPIAFEPVSELPPEITCRCADDDPGISDVGYYCNPGDDALSCRTFGTDCECETDQCPEANLFFDGMMITAPDLINRAWFHDPNGDGSASPCKRTPVGLPNSDGLGLRQTPGLLHLKLYDNQCPAGVGGPPSWPNTERRISNGVAYAAEYTVLNGESFGCSNNPIVKCGWFTDAEENDEIAHIYTECILPVEWGDLDLANFRAYTVNYGIVILGPTWDLAVDPNPRPWNRLWVETNLGEWLPDFVFTGFVSGAIVGCSTTASCCHDTQEEAIDFDDEAASIDCSPDCLQGGGRCYDYCGPFPTGLRVTPFCGDPTDFDCNVNPLGPLVYYKDNLT